MMSRTHVAFGITATIALTYFTKTNYNYWELIPGAILGSTLPDLDTEKSWAAQSIPLADDVLRKVGVLKHRGLTHSIFAIILIVILVIAFKNDFMIGMGLGYVSHILLDWLSGKMKITCKMDKWVYNIIWIINAICIYKLATGIDITTL